ncbi:hypothetical protein BTR25_26110 [Bacillus sp. MRMR6]|nr:hypothetical protein BTR25_26110 [Bacillus sp. MRMR6]
MFKEWTFQSNTINKSNLETLYISVFPIEMGWTSYDIEVTPFNIRVSLMPTFFVDKLQTELPEEEREILINISEKIALFVKEHKVELPASIPNDKRLFKDSKTIVYRECIW